MGWKWWNKEDNQHSKEAHSHPQVEEQPTYETKTFYRSYSSSRSCKPDPEDQNYLICTEKIQDGNQTYQKEERVPVNSNQSLFFTPFSQTRQFFRNDPFGHSSGNSSEQFQVLNKAMQQFMAPFFHFPSFFGLGPFSNMDRNHAQFGPDRTASGLQQPRAGSGEGRSSQQGQRRSEDRRQGDKRYYFSHNDEKNYDIKDI